MCIPHVCRCPQCPEGGTLSLNYRQLWVIWCGCWELNSCPLGAAIVLNHWTILTFPYIHNFLFVLGIRAYCIAQTGLELTVTQTAYYDILSPQLAVGELLRWRVTWSILGFTRSVFIVENVCLLSPVFERLEYIWWLRQATCWCLGCSWMYWRRDIAS